MSSYLDTKIEYLKGVGPQRSELLNKELKIFTFWDLLNFFPFRYEDRSQYLKISQISLNHGNIQTKGVITTISSEGQGRKMRLRAILSDETGHLELIWFQGAKWVEKKLKKGQVHVVYGKPSLFNRRINISHPDIEHLTQSEQDKSGLVAVYHSTEKLKSRFLDGKALGKLFPPLLEKIAKTIPESLSEEICQENGLMTRWKAYQLIHQPANFGELQRAKLRIKFEELFFAQLKIKSQKLQNQRKYKGLVFDNSLMVNEFYEKHLPFDLTNAQKRVVKESYRDMRSGAQMNRLIQGDVGSGKTIVAFICMLIAISNDTQTSLMAPTEILAEQHYNGLLPFAQKLGLNIALLTGSTKKSARDVIHADLESGKLHILVGTHALIESKVQFHKLGLAITDEQHRFGVAQRAKLWKAKGKMADGVFPHVLVMTATPIPRTLAMVVYGDLDVSIIDELPAGRKPIQTLHRKESSRARVYQFILEEIKKGRQAYCVFPLIEESETLEYKNLMEGYEVIQKAFPDLPISMLHGRLKSDEKEEQMKKFASGETKIMVATTVIEVGVNVPNASIMVIENAEKFGLAQLHQLRGRVGRGSEQSYCVLMTGNKVSSDGKTRIETMVRTNDGFEIANVDMKLRGPGDMMGTQQSGIADLKLVDLSQDGEILKQASHTCEKLLLEDPDISLPTNQPIRHRLDQINKQGSVWSTVG